MTKERMSQIKEICINHKATTKDIKDLVELYKECIRYKEYEKARDVGYGLSVIYTYTPKQRVKNCIRRGFSEMAEVKKMSCVK